MMDPDDDSRPAIVPSSLSSSSSSSPSVLASVSLASLTLEHDLASARRYYDEGSLRRLTTAWAGGVDARLQVVCVMMARLTALVLERAKRVTDRPTTEESSSHRLDSMKTNMVHVMALLNTTASLIAYSSASASSSSSSSCAACASTDDDDVAAFARASACWRRAYRRWSGVSVGRGQGRESGIERAIDDDEVEQMVYISHAIYVLLTTPMPQQRHRYQQLKGREDASIEDDVNSAIATCARALSQPLSAQPRYQRS